VVLVISKVLTWQPAKVQPSCGPGVLPRNRSVPVEIGLLLACALPGGGAAADRYAADIEPLLAEYCFDCHGGGMDEGGMTLDEYSSLDAHVADHDLWLPVWENLRSQLMPPHDKPQPSAAELDTLEDWIERSVFKLDPANPDPGRVTLRRLNREEYRHTILDLFQHNFHASQEFPPDDTGHGFTNNAEALSLSPLLLEKYLAAAREIVDEVIPTGPITPTRFFGGRLFRDETGKRPGRFSLNEPHTLSKPFSVPHPGPYRLTVEYVLPGAEHETDHTAELIARLNGEEVLSDFLAWGDSQPIARHARIHLPPGENKLEVEIRPRSGSRKGQRDLQLEFRFAKLHGPLDGSHVVYPSRYRRMFREGPPPTDPAARRRYAETLIDSWGLRILRRPLEPGRRDRLVRFIEQAEASGGRFEEGFAQAVTAMLASPRFLFRAAFQPEPDNPAKVVPIDEFALASRLSYFLWNSTPDEELLQLAARGELRSQLARQVNRLIADPKIERFVGSFTGQWLQTRNLDLLHLNPKRILGVEEGSLTASHFNHRVKPAMREETERVFLHILRENRSIREFLVADSTFLNDDLAEVYGIPGVKGRELRRVKLPSGSHRGGILGQGSFLIVTSNPSRTSPVKRGLFVLENLLGTPAPPAPEEVPPLEESRRKDKQPLTMRQAMEAHRKDPVCSSCHARMDPIGLALEHYNALGLWREEDRGRPIDASGRLLTGESFANAGELARILVTERRRDFYRCLTEKLLTYAIGRGVKYYDAPTVDAVVDRLEEDDGRMQTLILALIESAPFQNRRGAGHPASPSPPVPPDESGT